MSPTESNHAKVLAMLKERPLTVGAIGFRLWGVQASGQRAGYALRPPQAYARPAGKLLRAMERDGLVTISSGGRRQPLAWKLTLKGKQRTTRNHD